ncbi:hypothetical protein ABG067_006723 [Albugo candida]
MVGCDNDHCRFEWVHFECAGLIELESCLATCFCIPCTFGPKLHDIIRLRLIEEVEVLDAVVSVVNQLGFLADVGPLQVFVLRHAMPTDLKNGYDHENNARISGDREVEIRKSCGIRLRMMGVSIDVTETVMLDAVVSVVNQLGFLADVGPLQVFVLRHAMPTDLKNGYDHENNARISGDREVEIRKSCGIRLRMMGVSIDVTETVIGTCKRDFVYTASLNIGLKRIRVEVTEHPKFGIKSVENVLEDCYAMKAIVCKTFGLAVLGAFQEYQHFVGAYYVKLITVPSDWDVPSDVPLDVPPQEIIEKGLKVDIDPPLKSCPTGIGKNHMTVH